MGKKDVSLYAKKSCDNFVCSKSINHIAQATYFVYTCCVESSLTLETPSITISLSPDKYARPVLVYRFLSSDSSRLVLPLCIISFAPPSTLCAMFTNLRFFFCFLLVPFRRGDSREATFIIAPSSSMTIGPTPR